MAPFIGHPEGLSAATLELLDQGLEQMWRDMRIAAEAKIQSGPQGAPGEPPVGAPTIAAPRQSPKVTAARNGRR